MASIPGPPPYDAASVEIEARKIYGREAIYPEWKKMEDQKENSVHVSRRRYAVNIFSQLKGLMFDNTPDAELEFVLGKETRLGASIHTFFMRYPIHVEWLNSKREVVEEKTFRPWVLNYTPKHKASYIVERRVELK